MQMNISENWMIQGSNDPQILICGHSHSNCMFMALHSGLLPATIRGGAVFRRKQTKWNLGQGDYWDFVLKNSKDRVIAVMWNGNQHNASFLLAPKPPIRIYLDGSNQDSDIEALWVPAEMIKAHLKYDYDHLLSVLQRMVSVTVDTIVLGTPPPKPEGMIKKVLPNEAYFVSMAETMGIDLKTALLTSEAARLALWEIIQDTLMEAAAETGARYLPVPNPAFDENGFLREEYSAPDATHANASYGALIWQAISETLRH
jgi:hypothetical protein